MSHVQIYSLILGHTVLNKSTTVSIRDCPRDWPQHTCIFLHNPFCNPISTVPDNSWLPPEEWSSMESTRNHNLSLFSNPMNLEMEFWLSYDLNLVQVFSRYLGWSIKLPRENGCEIRHTAPNHPSRSVSTSRVGRNSIIS